MNKVYVNKETNQVEQIINIDIDTRWSEDWFPWCYIVDDADNSLKHHGYVYNLETEEFEEIEGYEEPETTFEPSHAQVLEERMDKKDAEILNLKLALADVSEEKDAEILKLKLALAELVEGGI